MLHHWLSRLTTNQRLALLALVLGVVAIGAKPTREGRVTLSPQDLALIVQRDADQVSARALAADLVKGEQTYRLVDVRSEGAFNAYHLPSAENIPIAVLASADLPRTERLLLYGDDGVHAAQAWFLLKAKGYRAVYMLRGGLAQWKDEVLYPVLSAGTTDEERRDNEQKAAVAAYLGGSPRAAASPGAAPAAAAVPAVAAAPAAAAAPQLPAGGAKPKAQAKKKEGC